MQIYSCVALSCLPVRERIGVHSCMLLSDIKSLLEMTFSVALLFDVDEPQLMEGSYVETYSNPT